MAAVGIDCHCGCYWLCCSHDPDLITWGLLLQYGKTPLHWASYNGRLQVVRQLLGAGAAADAKDKVRLAPQLSCISMVVYRCESQHLLALGVKWRRPALWMWRKLLRSFSTDGKGWVKSMGRNAVEMVHEQLLWRRLALGKDINILTHALLPLALVAVQCPYLSCKPSVVPPLMCGIFRVGNAMSSEGLGEVTSSTECITYCTAGKEDTSRCVLRIMGCRCKQGKQGCNSGSLHSSNRCALKGVNLPPILPYKH
jgi:hypothetical protein